MKRKKEKVMHQENHKLFSSMWFGPNALTSEENRRIKATAWINSYSYTIGGVPVYTETEWHGGALDILGQLRKLLVPIVALQVYGSAAEITAKVNIVLETIKIVREFNLLKDVFLERKQTLSDLETIASDLERIRPRMEDAEMLLEAEGWKYDTDVKKIRQLPSGERGKPGSFLARCCAAVYMAQYDGRKLDTEVLQGIKGHLSDFFPEEYLDASAKGSIYWAVKNRSLGPHNRKRKKTPKL